MSAGIAGQCEFHVRGKWVPPDRKTQERGSLPNIADNPPTRFRLLCPALLFGNQAVYELGPFLLINLDALRQEQLADLGDTSCLAVGDFQNLAFQVRCNAEGKEILVCRHAKTIAARESEGQPKNSFDSSWNQMLSFAITMMDCKGGSYCLEMILRTFWPERTWIMGIQRRCSFRSRGSSDF